MPVPKGDEPKSMPVLANRKVVSLKKVLVPLDFSDYASAAVDYAITIAGQADAHVVQLAAARRVALKMGRLLRCSSGTYRSRYAPSSRLADDPF
jgi:hypothetical protein